MAHIQDMDEFKQWVLAHEANGIKQRTPEWHTVRKGTVGGSTMSVITGENTFTTIERFVLAKAGLITNKVEGPAINWGNMFEDLIMRYVELEKECEVLGDNMFVPSEKWPGAAYSPDGVTMLNGVPTLLEFKCPYTRIPKGVIPPQYRAQMQMGMEVLDLDHGLFVDGVFRKCTVAQLSTFGIMSPPALFSKTVSTGEPVAYGFIRFSIAEDVPTEHSELTTKFLEDYIRTYTSIKPTNDLGIISREFLWETMLELVNLRVIHIAYSDVYLTKLHSSSKEHHASQFAEFAAGEAPLGWRNIGVMPWKLLEAKFIPVQRTPGYMDTYYPLIKTVVDAINELSATEDDIARRELYRTRILEIKALQKQLNTAMSSA